MKMTNTGPPIPVPNQSAANGTQAIGATKRMLSKNGVISWFAKRDKAIKRPKGIPIATANKNPYRNRLKLEAIWANRVYPERAHSSNE